MLDPPLGTKCEYEVASPDDCPVQYPNHIELLLLEVFIIVYMLYLGISFIVVAVYEFMLAQ